MQIRGRAINYSDTQKNSREEFAMEETAEKDFPVLLIRYYVINLFTMPSWAKSTYDQINHTIESNF